MKNMLSDWYDIIQNYLSLKKMNKENTRIEWNNITIKNVKRLVDYNDNFQNFYQAYQTFQNLEEDLQKWIMENLFLSLDVTQITEESIQLFYEKVFLCDVHPEIVRNNKKQFSRIEFVLNSDLYSKVLSYLGMGTIVEEDICKLDNLFILGFLNDYPSIDILGLLSLTDCNRKIYIEEYQPSISEILDGTYENIQNMKSSNFKMLVQMIKSRYSSFEFYDRLVHSYDYLDEIARVYGQSEEEIADFVFHAFPDFTDVSARGFQNGIIDANFQKMIEVITYGKTKEELDHLKNVYFEFLNHSHFAVKELRYQLLTDSRFLSSFNRLEIMELLVAKDTSEYIGKLNMLLASGIYEAEKLAEDDYQFIKGADKYLEYDEQVEAMKRRIQLVLTPSFSYLPNKHSITEQINKCSSFDTEKEVLEEVLDCVCSSNNHELEDHISLELLSLEDRIVQIPEKEIVLFKNKPCKKS